MVDWPKPIPITLAIMAGLWALLVVLAAPLPGCSTAHRARHAAPSALPGD